MEMARENSNDWRDCSREWVMKGEVGICTEGGDAGRLPRDFDSTEESADDQDDSPCPSRRRGALVR